MRRREIFLIRPILTQPIYLGAKLDTQQLPLSFIEQNIGLVKEGQDIDIKWRIKLYSWIKDSLYDFEDCLEKFFITSTVIVDQPLF